MKKETGSNIKLGIFVTVGVLLFIFAIYWLGSQQNLFGSTFRISAVFNSVSGLQPGNNVRFSGINVGTVDRIEIISDTTVRVDLIIEEDVRKFIKKDALAGVGSEGLMGNRVINIVPGNPSSPIIEENDYLSSIPPLDMDQIMYNFQTTSQNAAIITNDIAEIVHRINNGEGTLGALLNDSSIAMNLNQTLVNMKQGTRGFGENMEALKSNFLLRSFYKNKEKEAADKVAAEQKAKEEADKSAAKEAERKAKEAEKEAARKAKEEKRKSKAQ
jgi:phospholipid/cholesterol/gamma-HCH transport system substrate-binding protein